MAAGGPIVEPTARNLLLTPICPHSTRAGSYVLSPDHTITIEAADANRKFVYLSVDGGKAFSLKNGDTAVQIHHKAGAALQEELLRDTGFKNGNGGSQA